LKTNVCSHTVGVMVSYPSPTSRSGRCLGIRRGGLSDVVRALVRRLIAWAIALGRPGLGSQTRKLAQGVPRAGSSVPSKARPTLVGMNRTPHLERLAAPAKAVSRAGLVRHLRAHLARSPRARLAGSSRARLARACDPVWRTAATPGTHNSPAKPTSPPPIPLLESQTHGINRTIPCNTQIHLHNLYINPTPNTPRPTHAPVLF
jgi:hypothetical protein